MAREVTLVDAGLGNIASVERALIQVGGAVRVTGDPDQVARARMVVFPGQGAFGTATDAIIDGAMGAALRMVIERGDPFLGICLGMQLLFDGSDENGGREGLHVLPGRCRRFPEGIQIPAEPGAAERLRVVLPTPPVPEATPATVPEPEEPPQTEPLDTGLHGFPAETAANAGEPAGGGESHSFLGSSGWSSSLGLALAEDEEDEAGYLRAVQAEPRNVAVATPTVVASRRFDDRPPLVSDTEPLLRRLKVPHMGWNEVEPTGDHYYFVHSYYADAENEGDVMWMATFGNIRFPAAVRRDNVLGCQFHPEKSQRAGLKFLRAFLLGGWG